MKLKFVFFRQSLLLLSSLPDQTAEMRKERRGREKGVVKVKKGENRKEKEVSKEGRRKERTLRKRERGEDRGERR